MLVSSFIHVDSTPTYRSALYSQTIVMHVCAFSLIFCRVYPDGVTCCRTCNELLQYKFQFNGKHARCDNLHGSFHRLAVVTHLPILGTRCGIRLQSGQQQIFVQNSFTINSISFTTSYHEFAKKNQEIFSKPYTTVPSNKPMTLFNQIPIKSFQVLSERTLMYEYTHRHQLPVSDLRRM